MSYQTPCSNPENDPNDWFISRDGKQYPDEELPGYGNAEVAKAWAAEEERLGRALTEDEERKVDDRVFDEALKAQLRRRRHARDRCHTECYFRTQCLDIAISEGQAQGTWGGYYEEELREIRREIARRRRVRRA